MQGELRVSFLFQYHCIQLPLAHNIHVSIHIIVQTQQQLPHYQQQPSNPQTSTSKEDKESFIISVLPGAWPPHQNTFGCSNSNNSGADGAPAQHNACDISAPLPTGTSSGDDKSPRASHGEQVQISLQEEQAAYQVELLQD